MVWVRRLINKSSSGFVTANPGNSNAQSEVQQYGGSNSNLQSGVQQASRRRANANSQSRVQQLSRRAAEANLCSDDSKCRKNFCEKFPRLPWCVATSPETEDPRYAEICIENRRDPACRRSVCSAFPRLPWCLLYKLEDLLDDDIQMVDCVPPWCFSCFPWCPDPPKHGWFYNQTKDRIKAFIWELCLPL